MAIVGKTFLVVLYTFLSINFSTYVRIKSIDMHKAAKMNLNTLPFMNRHIASEGAKRAEAPLKSLEKLYHTSVICMCYSTYL